MKIDLHCHSKYSKRPTLWIMQKIGCPESFTEPVELYHLARARGMDAVTITDHNVIDGCLEILHLPNTLMGCEYTTYFPEDRCKVHVLAYGFTEAQHAELSRLRENIYEFTAYMNQHGIVNVCAHPFFGPNELLTADHVEKLCLLYKNWEINGDQSPVMNRAVSQVIAQLTPAQIARLAEKHGIAPVPEAWRKNISCGSDDHSSLHLADAYTEVPGATSLAEFWAGFARGKATIHHRPASPHGFARNVYGIAYQFYKSKLGLDRHVNKDFLLRFLDRTLQTRIHAPESWASRMQGAMVRRLRARGKAGSDSLFSLARSEAEKLIRGDAHLSAIVNAGGSHAADLDKLWFRFVNELSNRVLVHLGNQLLDRAVHARILDLFDSAATGGALYAMVSPYMFAYSHYRHEERFSVSVLKRFLGEQVPDEFTTPCRVAHFTDTWFDVNGVARTLQQQRGHAARLRKDYTVITSHAGACKDTLGAVSFEAIGQFELPEYPELRLLAPPLLSMLDYCAAQGFSHIHLATPGPVGLAGLLVARILRLPVSGTYHTAFPEYAKALTDDTYVEDLAWRYMLWFYDQLDTVFAPSRATATGLLERGMNPEKVKVYPRGVDVHRFSPVKRDSALRARYGVSEGETAFLYVGRISREKNLDVLAEAYREFLRNGHRARLIVTGDGPYRGEMQQLLEGSPACFTGYVEGEELSALYASCDVFVFPSTTDTFGNVVLEAQASGIPAIVTTQGGPAENILPGKTGLLVPPGNPSALAEAMGTLARSRILRETMGAEARVYMESRSFDQAFSRLWEMYTAGTVPPAPMPAPSPLVVPMAS